MSVISFCLFVLIMIPLLFLLRRYLKGPQARNKKSLKGKVIIVTGASSGIGRETAIDLIKHGAQVILACRNEAKTNEAMKILTEEEKKLTKFIRLDLCDFDSIIKFADSVKKEFPKIDIMVNNAGLFPQNFAITKDNMETIIQGNFAGHVLLTYLLFDILDKNEARIINLSSIVHPLSDFKNEVNIKELYDAEKSKSKYYTGFEPKWRLYSNTKMLMLYFSKYLTNICEAKYKYIKSASLHPGCVFSDFLRFAKNNIFQHILYYILIPIFNFFFKTTKDGAQTQLNLCYIPFNELVSGAYYADCSVNNTKGFANDVNKINECMKLTFQEIQKRIPETITVNGKQIVVKELFDL